MTAWHDRIKDSPAVRAAPSDEAQRLLVHDVVAALHAQVLVGLLRARVFRFHVQPQPHRAGRAARCATSAYSARNTPPRRAASIT